jgi:hypothetical protein
MGKTEEDQKFMEQIEGFSRLANVSNTYKRQNALVTVSGLLNFCFLIFFNFYYFYYFYLG